ncbi:hypothetical protein [uncultured Hyphomonas sp.]|jgi:ABC-type lipoprotein release transport system permease subunit|uniref:hypothetical protein n=1 Tax=uncultured Hyphomonas sp. TaxID=225298 RepID=UPI000C42FB39|nr:hypothetical protein [Hyphomonadaceae bacterium]MBA27453.1 hypothetical protein [Hyphomonadaceae bacterium]|tara:strand:+ start:271 stop:627 length:357 start_codon:yes stop_codon:yes gene_type:complete
MAYASGIGISSLAGVVGAVVGGYIGFTQAADVSNLEPVSGALILGAIGFVAGSAGAFLLKSLMQFVIYIILFGIVAYFFQHQIESLTGINPVSATLNFLADLGLPVSAKDSVLVTDPS